MVVLREFFGKFVENVGGVAETCEQHDRSSGAAPVEYFQLNIVVNGDELNVMLRWILPPGVLSNAPQKT